MKTATVLVSLAALAVNAYTITDVGLGETCDPIARRLLREDRRQLAPTEFRFCESGLRCSNERASSSSPQNFICVIPNGNTGCTQDADCELSGYQGGVCESSTCVIDDGFSCFTTFGFNRRRQLGEGSILACREGSTCNEGQMCEANRAPSFQASGAGDPHFQMLNGTYITCNDLGAVEFMSGNDWTAEIDVFAVGSGSAIDNFTISFPSASPATQSLKLTTAGWTPQTINAGTAQEIVVDAEHITLSGYDTIFSVQVSGNHLDIQVFTSDTIVSGTLVDGCVGPEVVLPSGAVAQECAGLSAPFDQFCNFDLTESSGDTTFVASAQFMQDTTTTFVPTASPVVADLK